LIFYLQKIYETAAICHPHSPQWLNENRTRIEDGNIVRVGLIVNPVAGMGGKVGLKGTDGIVKEAVAKGAKPVAPKRATEFLGEFRQLLKENIVEVLACPGRMGAEEAKEAGVPVRVLPMSLGKETSARDTEEAVRLLGDAKVELIVFVGGDGTAKDILDAMKGKADIPVLGVPAGVKMYSGIFAINPSLAAQAVVSFVENRAEVSDFEVMDADESAIRADVFDVRLYGCLKGLSLPALLQGSKEVTPETVSEKDSQDAIASYVVEELPKNATLILGPGTTVRRIAEFLGVKKTVLGVDIYLDGKVTLDADENTLLKTINDWGNTWIILSPIGHQGILIGRGNQQISPEVIRRVGKQRILVVATLNKLGGIEGKSLTVDTGEAETDGLLRGEILVVTGYKQGVWVSVQ
jgi:predicted polyphosphate/ATP-dependent NAD kinase